MLNHCILVSGPIIAADQELVSNLQKSAVVLQNKDNTQIESILSNQNVDLIILEIIKKNASELEMIKKVKITFPKIAIILIDGDRELMAEAFANGVNDAFRKPYKSSLIVERVNALLNR